MDLYQVDEEYNKFLQDYEREHRGVTKVPNIHYADKNKFLSNKIYAIISIK